MDLIAFTIVGRAITPTGAKSAELQPIAFNARAIATDVAQGFYPISTDGLKRAENFKSCRATLRRIRGL
jgi:hypothetical protein